MVAIPNFNAQDHENAFTPLPNDVYTAVMTHSEEKPTNAGNGKVLHLTFQIVSGEHSGRQIKDFLTHVHPKQQTVNIALARLGDICRAVGVLEPRDTSELHNKPLKIVVVVTKRSDTGEDTNKIKAYHPVDWEPESAKVASGAGTGGGKPPWM